MTATHRTRSWTDTLEEGFIAFTLLAMTAVTFANVIARYVFNSNILWAVEMTGVLFAWLVLIGASYAVRTGSHLGVDVVVNAVPAATRRILTLVTLLACLVWAVIFVWSSFEYWWPFATRRTFYEVEDIPMPWLLSWLSVVNDGEAYEKVPRFLPYLVLPIASVLLLFRLAQVGWRIVRGSDELLIAGHEAEDMVEEVREREVLRESAEAVDPRADGNVPSGREPR